MGVTAVIPTDLDELRRRLDQLEGDALADVLEELEALLDRLDERGRA